MCIYSHAGVVNACLLICLLCLFTAPVYYGYLLRLFTNAQSLIPTGWKHGIYSSIYDSHLLTQFTVFVYYPYLLRRTSQLFRLSEIGTHFLQNARKKNDKKTKIIIFAPGLEPLTSPSPTDYYVCWATVLCWSLPMTTPLEVINRAR